MERPYLLVSDLDHTLLGDEASLARFAEWYEARRPQVRLAYSSGRFRWSVEQSIAETALPVPDAIIGGVGTEIYITADQQPLSDWPTHRSGWNLDTIWSVLRSQEALRPQPEEFQSRFKASCYGDNLSHDFLRQLGDQLRCAGQQVEIVYSSRRDLDVLPCAANKGAAAAHLAQYWKVAPERTIAAGDSGNDRAMFEQGFLGIVVENAHDELKALGGERVYLARQPFAAGVLEGLQHWIRQ